MPLERQHRETLSVLGYLYLRMGELDRAGRLFAALLAVTGDAAPDHSARLAHAGLAAVDVERGEAASALEHLHEAMAGQVLSSRSAALHLLRAKALWRQGRESEARQAGDMFVHLAGSSARQAGSDLEPVENT
jgi:hypothetical protein